jgi:hypothetical protein
MSEHNFRQSCKSVADSFENKYDGNPLELAVDIARVKKGIELLEKMVVADASAIWSTLSPDGVSMMVGGARVSRYTPGGKYKYTPELEKRMKAVEEEMAAIRECQENEKRFEIADYTPGGEPGTKNFTVLVTGGIQPFAR